MSDIIDREENDVFPEMPKSVPMMPRPYMMSPPGLPLPSRERFMTSPSRRRASLGSLSMMSPSDYTMLPPSSFRSKAPMSPLIGTGQTWATSPAITPASVDGRHQPRYRLGSVNVYERNGGSSNEWFFGSSPVPREHGMDPTTPPPIERRKWGSLFEEPDSVPLHSVIAGLHKDGDVSPLSLHSADGESRKGRKQEQQVWNTPDQWNPNPPGWSPSANWPPQMPLPCAFGDNDLFGNGQMPQMSFNAAAQWMQGPSQWLQQGSIRDSVVARELRDSGHLIKRESRGRLSDAGRKSVATENGDGKRSSRKSKKSLKEAELLKEDKPKTGTAAICTWFLKGECRFGDKCSSRHPSDEEMATQEMQDLQQAAMQSVDQKNGPVTCTWWLQSNCRFGDKCRNLHQLLSEVAPTLSQSDEFAKNQKVTRGLAKLHKIEEMKARGEEIDPEWLASSGKKSKRAKARITNETGVVRPLLAIDGDGRTPGRMDAPDSRSPSTEPDKPKSSRGRRGGVNRSKGGGSNKGGKGGK